MASDSSINEKEFDEFFSNQSSSISLSSWSKQEQNQFSSNQIISSNSKNQSNSQNKANPHLNQTKSNVSSDQYSNIETSNKKQHTRNNKTGNLSRNQNFLLYQNSTQASTGKTELTRPIPKQFKTLSKQSSVINEASSEVQNREGSQQYLTSEGGFSRINFDQQKKMNDGDDITSQYTPQNRSDKPYSKKGKPPKPNLNQKDHIPRADVAYRLDMGHKLFNQIQNKEPFINKKLLNELIPASLKNATKKTDDALFNVIQAWSNQQQYDFKEGIYQSLPADPRGQQLINIRKIAEAKALRIQNQFNNLANVINVDFERPSTRTQGQKKALQQIYAEKFDTSSENEEQKEFAKLNREQTQIDLRVVETSEMAARSFKNNYRKANYQAEQVKKYLQAQSEQVEQAKQIRTWQQTEPLRQQINAQSHKNETTSQEKIRSNPYTTFLNNSIDLQKNDKAKNSENAHQTRQALTPDISTQAHSMAIPGLKTYFQDRKNTVMGPQDFHNKRNTFSNSPESIQQSFDFRNSNPNTTSLPNIRLKPVLDQTKNGKSQDQKQEQANKQISTETKSEKKSSLEKPSQKVVNQKQVELQALLIKPGYDASDQEIHMRNNFSHSSQNVKQFMKTAYKDSDQIKSLFKPRLFGQNSKNNKGITTNLIQADSKPDFKRIEYTANGKELRVPEENPESMERKTIIKIKKKGGKGKKAGLSLTPEQAITPNTLQRQQNLVEIKEILNESISDDESQQQRKSRALTSLSQVDNQKNKQPSEMIKGSSGNSGQNPKAQGSEVRKIVQVQQKNKEMSLVIDQLVRDIDPLDRVHAKKGEKFITMTDSIQKTLNKAEENNSQIESFLSSRYLLSDKSDNQFEDDGRVRRSKLEGSVPLAAREVAYRSDNQNSQFKVAKGKQKTNVQNRQTKFYRKFDPMNPATFIKDYTHLKQSQLQKRIKDDEIETEYGDGLIKDLKYIEPPQFDEQIEMINPKTGQKIAPYRAVDRLVVDRKKLEEHEEQINFFSELRANKKDRILDPIYITFLIEEYSKSKKYKSNQEYQREGKTVVKDEVEDEILKKWTNHNTYKTKGATEDIFQLPKSVVYDDINNGYQYRSVAQFQTAWRGQDGQFNKQHIISWFKNFQKTKVIKSYKGSLKQDGYFIQKLGVQKLRKHNQIIEQKHDLETVLNS